MPGKISPSVGERRVLIFPAMTPKIENRRVYFLFSIRQVEDIIQDVNICPVPFAPSYTEGLGWWREQAIPVISLESRLGLKRKPSRKDPGFMLIRSAGPPTRASEQGPPSGAVDLVRTILKVDRGIHIAALPIKCEPVATPWIPNQKFIRGAYEWDQGFLVVADINTVLYG